MSVDAFLVDLTWSVALHKRYQSGAKFTLVPKLQDGLKTLFLACKNIWGEKISLENMIWIHWTFKALFKPQFIALKAFIIQQVWRDSDISILLQKYRSLVWEACNMHGEKKKTPKQMQFMSMIIKEKHALMKVRKVSKTWG